MNTAVDFTLNALPRPMPAAISCGSNIRNKQSITSTATVCGSSSPYRSTVDSAPKGSVAGRARPVP